MKILIIGCNGQLGRDMVIESKKSGHDVFGIDFPDIDLTDPSSVQNVCDSFSPESIINCAAYTAVDACESDTQTAYAVNGTGVAHIAAAANSINASVVHISTDYVFDGNASRPYIESDATNPQSVYGKSKLKGEQELISLTKKHFIFRIAWLYGTQGNNFVKTIQAIALKKRDEGQPLKVVHDQFGTPTYTKDVCSQILGLMQTNHFGLYHCTNEGACSWYDFASFILNNLAIEVDLLPCTTEEFPRPAPRPHYSVLENHNLKLIELHTMRPWQQAFMSFLEEFKANS